MEWKEEYRKLIIEYEPYRKHWIAWVIAPLGAEGDFWFKGTGPTPQEALASAEDNRISGYHVSKRITESRYVKGGYERATIPPKTTDINIDELEFKL